MGDQSARIDSTGEQETSSTRPEPVRDAYGISNSFLCSEDQDLWSQLHPSNVAVGTHKELESLRKKLKEDYGMKDQLWKLLKRFLQGHDQEHVVNKDFLSFHGFIAVTKWFGSFKRMKKGNTCYCLQQVENLMKKGGVKRGKSFVSWFAGFITNDEAYKYLRKEKCGTFLVRFSESLSSEGGFCVAVKLKDDEVLQYQIKGDYEQACNGERYNANLRLNSELKEARDIGPCTNIVEFVDALRCGVDIEGDFETFCPGLPLNATFQGYS
uniref:Uncharacterized protein LOC100182506 n=1 Tax=Phallusia mammillata TaxID=59560 RepID=A0A6F9DGZ9_9ASCI|nr:uncharacterized protein LOC100182506 [Phallusia mammillata]